MEPTTNADASPVERPVKPIGYLHGEDFIPHGPNGWTGGVPVFDQDALDAAVAEERERCLAAAREFRRRLRGTARQLACELEMRIQSGA